MKKLDLALTVSIQVLLAAMLISTAFLLLNLQDTWALVQEGYLRITVFLLLTLTQFLLVLGSIFLRFKSRFASISFIGATISGLFTPSFWFGYIVFAVVASLAGLIVAEVQRVAAKTQ